MDDERSLITRAQRGDVKAYAALVRQHEQIAFRAAFLILHDQPEAADTVQDAFLRAYRSLDSFKLERPFRPWLLRIITNVALNRIQAIERRKRATERYAQELSTSQNEIVPDHALATNEQNTRLQLAVRQLSADEQALIALRYFLELPDGEVAETLGIPIGTVKSRLHRTLTRLRAIIHRDFPDLQELTTFDS
ncbi:MAG: RNA polymerase sigma factor [Chloroflexi bacterium]|nr:RNA polymerase sigma factor [Chloroflexota bacterium]